MLFLYIYFCQYLQKMHLIPIQDFFTKNVQVIKKTDIFDCKVFKLQRFSKVLPNAMQCNAMLVETPYSGMGHNRKTYLNHDLGSIFFPG